MLRTVFRWRSRADKVTVTPVNGLLPRRCYVPLFASRILITTFWIPNSMPKSEEHSSSTTLLEKILTGPYDTPITGSIVWHILYAFFCLFFFTYSISLIPLLVLHLWACTAGSFCFVFFAFIFRLSICRPASYIFFPLGGVCSWC